MALKQQQQGVSRRGFIAGTVGTGLVMSAGLVLPGCSRDDAAAELKNAGASRSFAPTVWFEINGDGAINVNIAKAEMGQHVGTALARIVADELGANWDDVTFTHVDTDPKWGYMVTGGSWSVVNSFAMLSQAGAAGRTVLLEAGAALMGIDSGETKVINSTVVAGDQSLTFAEIVSTGDISRSFSADELAALPTKPASERTLIGKNTTANDIPEKSRGEAVYGLDVELDNMVFAAPVLPPTRYGSTINSIDDSAAKSIKGYLRTLTINDPSETIQGWVLAIAESFPAAQKAAAAISVDWQAGPTANVSEQDILDVGETLARDHSIGTLLVDDGDVSAAREQAAATLSSTYTTATVLHFALEPQNALVEFVDGKCHVHAGNQWQSLILPVLAKALELPETDIVIHQYYLGGGFGRRLFGDQMIPAALAARELKRPVKLVFPRDEDSRFDCVRSPSVAHFDASFAADKSLSGVDHGAAAGWPTLSMAPGFLGDGVDGKGKYDSFSISGANHWYSLPAHRVRAINNDLAQKTFLPGWLRAVGPGWVSWGVECFMDELAERAGVDPIEYRLQRLDASGKNAGEAPFSVGGASRLAAVLKDVRARAPWGSDLPAGEGLGVAIAQGQERALPTWTAVIAHVAVDEQSINVKKIWQSIDCGTVVHPDGAMAQAEGATLWGVSLALHESSRFNNGEVRNTNLDTYTPLRIDQVPELDIRFMESTEVPTGLGEPPLIAVAPAIGNAFYAATGKRVKDLPIHLG